MYEGLLNQLIGKKVIYDCGDYFTVTTLKNYKSYIQDNRKNVRFFKPYFSSASYVVSYILQHTTYGIEEFVPIPY